MTLKPYIKDNLEYYYTKITKNIRVSVKTDFLSDQSDVENNFGYGLIIS